MSVRCSLLSSCESWAESAVVDALMSTGLENIEDAWHDEQVPVAAVSLIGRRLPGWRVCIS